MGARLTLGPVTNPLNTHLTLGTLGVEFPTSDRAYFVYRMSILGPANTIAKVYIGFGTNGAYRAVSYWGGYDDADFPAGLYVPAALPLYVAWYSVGAPYSYQFPSIITGPGVGAATAILEMEYEEAILPLGQ